MFYRCYRRKNLGWREVALQIISDSFRIAEPVFGGGGYSGTLEEIFGVPVFCIILVNSITCP